VVRVLEMSALAAGQSSVTIRTSGLSAEGLAGLAQWGSDVRADGEHITLNIPNDTVLPEITRYLVGQGAQVYALTPNRSSLEEIFIETVGKDGGL